MGLPGNPKITFCFPLILANKIGFPGLIATPLKKLDNLKSLMTPGTKSNFPAETAPEVTIISILALHIFLI